MLKNILCAFFMRSSPLSIFSTSSVYCLVSPTSPPMNLKRSTVQSERLCNSHHLRQHYSWPMRNSHFLLQVPLQGTTNMCILRSPKEDSQWFFFVFKKTLHKMYCKGHFTAACQCFFVLANRGKISPSSREAQLPQQEYLTLIC